LWPSARNWSGNSFTAFPLSSFTMSGNHWWCSRGASTASQTGISNSITFSVTHSTVLMMVRPPGLPVTSTGLPPFSTSVGVIELNMRLPGATRFGGVPISPVRVVIPGFALKSVISLFRMKPAPRTTIRLPKAFSSV